MQPQVQSRPHSLPAALEQHRRRLEESLANLNKALDNWRVYSFEYEAFREELQALPEGATREQMLEVGKDVEGTLVDEREICSLLGDKVGIKRTRDAVINAVSHRIEYVDENIKKVQKQIDEAEQKIAHIFIISEPDFKNEEGLSVMDIQEELDEEGNIMNAWVNGKDPDAAVRTLDPEALLKLGKAVGDLEKIKKEVETKQSEAKQSETAISMEVDTPQSTEASKSIQSVSKDVPAKSPSPMEIDSAPAQNAAFDSEEEDKEEEGGGYVRVTDDPEEPKPEDWVKEVPGESEEDMRLRQQMLQYNMSEIGAVVAELNLEEDGDYYGYEDYSDHDEDEEEYSEEEDEYGRSMQRVVSDSYRRQMEELEERLTGKPPGSKQAAAQAESAKPATGKKGVRFAEELDIAPTPPPAPKPAPAQLAQTQPDQIDFAPDENDALPFLEKLLERQEITNAGPTPVVPIPPAPVEKPKPKPKVSLFKREKMAPSPLRQMETSQASTTTTETVKETVKETLKETAGETAKEYTIKERVVPTSTLSESITERTPGAPTAPVMAPSLPAKKLSRFAAARAAAKSQPEPDPEPEEPKLMADTVIERTSTSRAKPPSEFDMDIHRQEVAMQYHKLRSKMIHQQGGFVETDEDRAIVPLDEDGEKVKISRFKAARLRGVGNQ
ncbi:Prefoldin subunit-domain-containing protein [Sphaerosporella brunnea]|uniref:Prefoldin subunit-domain-containing protein n=1 Tax=Sphaerosporella brunnea TaxID=1250544 RepID=A0A5J5EJI2_9PEZI|nr:Prefoldin subunit-domain-containing protein [Sphaerosporella brunnea]